MKRTFADYADKRKVNSWCPTNKGTPGDYSYGSAKKFKFICFKCKHPIELSLSSITRVRKGGSTWCGYCSERLMCGVPECMHCYKRSFEYVCPKKSLEWSSRNTKLPSTIPSKSETNFWFDCSICG